MGFGSVCLWGLAMHTFVSVCLGNICLWDLVMHLCLLVWAMYVCGFWQCVSVGPSNAFVSVGLGNVRLWVWAVYVCGFWQCVSVCESQQYTWVCGTWLCICGPWQCMSMGPSNAFASVGLENVCWWVLATCVCGA